MRGVENLPADPRASAPALRMPARAVLARRPTASRIAPARIPIEIAFLEQYGVPRAALATAVEIARRLGVGADSVLLAEGLVPEEFFYRALADRLGAPYYSGGGEFVAVCDPHAAIASGFIALADADDPRAVVAPRGPALALLLGAREAGRPRPPIAICGRQRLGALIRVGFAAEIARDASERLGAADPTFTARTGSTAAQRAGVALVAFVAICGWTFDCGPPRLAISWILWLLFTAGIWLRSMAVAAAESPPASPLLADIDLPIYTVIVALYREARVLARLTRALDALDYPRAKLDIKLVLERDDSETLAGIAALRLPPRYDVIVAPPGAPRTKPRALNIALAVARGELVVIYDAEDEPAPDQLRLAAARFAAEPGLDALQARLTVANPSDDWLSELFAIEYAALFDLVNPGLAALDLPVALGGSSNHFRLGVLRRIGGWDAWNVTEDVDLGIRLARFGARVGALASDTAEEAPNDLGNWLRQRVRWQKGWMQTLMVHSRRPTRLFRELGARRALGALTLVGGAVIGGLFGPLLLIGALSRISREDFAAGGGFARAGDVLTCILALAGAQSVAIPALVAMHRRGMSGAGRALARMPFYYALVCLASWAALFQLVVRPFYWGKTEHGRALRDSGDSGDSGFTPDRNRATVISG